MRRLGRGAGPCSRTSTVTSVLTAYLLGLLGLIVIAITCVTLGDLWLLLWAVGIVALLRAIAKGELL